MWRWAMILTTMCRSEEATSMNVPATIIAFEKRYSDGSGVRFAVRYDSTKEMAEIEFDSVDAAVDFPVDQLDWLIRCLVRIKEELAR